jgi:Cu(I)/Ag(I) efflux system protein CusF
MKRATVCLVILGFASLAACSPKGDGVKTAASEAASAPAAAPAATPPAANAAAMANMGMASEAKMAKGTGKVTAIDARAGTVTLQHGPIAEAGWPAMTMAFKATPAIVGQVKIGDKVDFDLVLKDGGGEITSVRKVNG